MSTVWNKIGKLVREIFSPQQANSSRIQSTFNNKTITVMTQNNKTIISINDTIVYDGPELIGSVSIRNGELFVGNHHVSTEHVPEARTFNITIIGDVAGAVATTSGNISVGGNVGGGVETMSGDVQIQGTVYRDVETTSGDVYLRGDLAGAINTVSGDVEVGGSVGGPIDTVSGDISAGGRH